MQSQRQSETKKEVILATVFWVGVLDHNKWSAERLWVNYVVEQKSVTEWPTVEGNLELAGQGLLSGKSIAVLK